MFQDTLNKALHHVEGAQACILMGFDGIPIASAMSPEASAEALLAMAVEVASLVGRLHRSASSAELGALRDLSLRTERYAAVTQVVLGEYVLILAVQPSADLERGARLLRLLRPRVEALL